MILLASLILFCVALALVLAFGDIIWALVLTAGDALAIAAFTLLRWLGFSQRRCSWCQRLLGFKRVVPRGITTHGICRACAAKHFPK